ncbi:NAD-P-binding protein [Mycena alexandri]|uniref:NAD-P-binding protein n=1 Tax=Mycena alexandri TaxID=1745969 RepID=A0AAD6SK11_9AGAR|nr:NAD-P-binding protein [Mycena alexandri]
MPALSAVRAFNAAYAPTYLPVAIFVDGTSGIGRATAETFARSTKGNAHIILVGRNVAAAHAILGSFPKPTFSSLPWKHEFVECDISLLRHVHTTVVALLRRLRRVNFLMLSTGSLSLAGRDETTEGLDRGLVLGYYTRWAFAVGMLSALRRAREAGEPAGVMSVLTAGHGHHVDLNDLGLDRGYTGKAAMDASATYTELMVEELAVRYPDLSFTYTLPGLINTPLFAFEHWGARLTSPVIKLGLHVLAKSEPDAAEYQLYGLLHSNPGVHRRGEHGDEITAVAAYGSGSSAASRALWAHTREVVNARV